VHKIVSTPAYLLASGPAQVYTGVKKLVDEVLRLA
jgi:enhancing lycopene biosynthesis protein 2